MPVRWDLPDDSDDEVGGVEVSRQYEQTLMYGRYTRDLGDTIKRSSEIKKKKEEEPMIPIVSEELLEYKGSKNKIKPILKKIWKYTFSKIGEDWAFLALLGFIMAIISFLMDYGISRFNQARIFLYKDLSRQNPILQYMSWIALPLCLITFSAAFVHLTAPQAVGSGIPEMKTILRGVVLKEYLTFKTLVAKVVGLTATLGSGLPLGKEGPFVHIASIVATILSKAITSFKGIFENESRNSEMLSAACAVGVACSFASPIGGVLFSIEVTSVYFAVRNYWRGFFAAVCGAMMFRLLAVWFKDEVTLTALFRTSFMKDFPFDPMEMFVFGSMGLACGLIGAFFVYVHRHYVLFMRRNKKMKNFLQKSRLFYPIIVTLLYSTLSFPLLFGRFVAGKLTTHEQVVELFSNITWTKENPSVNDFKVIENWRTPWTGIFANLVLYIIFTFVSSVVASTLPVPSGIFIPVFKMGAALGRIFGELMAIMFPNGLSYGGVDHLIIPGGYSIVGAAALSGAVTHTISTSVIVFELSGQITHILPVMIAVLISNGVSQMLQPSIYDSIIKIKKLPYLPDILTSTTGAYHIYVEDFMIRNVKYIWYEITYRELKDILIQNKKIRSLPLVDSPDSMILLGSIQRSDLISIIENHLGKERRKAVANKWKLAAQQVLENEALNTEQKSGQNSFRSFSSFCKQILMHNGKDHTDHSAHNSKPTLQNMFTKPKNEEITEMNETQAANVELSVPLITHKPNTSQHNFVSQLKPSRFAVTKVETPTSTDSTVKPQVKPEEISDDSPPSERSSINSHTFPRKSILKKTQSIILHPVTNLIPATSLHPNRYATVHGVIDTTKFRHTFQSDMKKRKTSKPELEISPESEKATIEIEPELRWQKTLEEQLKWEEEEFDKTVDFTEYHIDPAPFQLVERTSLLKVHSLFSMLGLNHAYVTVIGRLIGVVALKELRKAIEEANQGEFKPNIERRVSLEKQLQKIVVTTSANGSAMNLK